MDIARSPGRALCQAEGAEGSRDRKAGVVRLACTRIASASARLRRAEQVGSLADTLPAGCSSRAAVLLGKERHLLLMAPGSRQLTWMLQGKREFKKCRPSAAAAQHESTAALLAAGARRACSALEGAAPGWHSWLHCRAIHSPKQGRLAFLQAGDQPPNLPPAPHLSLPHATARDLDSGSSAPLDAQ